MKYQTEGIRNKTEKRRLTKYIWYKWKGSKERNTQSDYFVSENCINASKHVRTCWA